MGRFEADLQLKVGCSYFTLFNIKSFICPDILNDTQLYF